MTKGSDGLSLPDFMLFMRVERVESLRRRLADCIASDQFERAAAIRDLIAEREGKLEIQTESNVPAYFDIAPAR